jgi:hypothetical protein
MPIAMNKTDARSEYALAGSFDCPFSRSCLGTSFVCMASGGGYLSGLKPISIE